MTLHIRPATHDDLAAVSALLAETWHATYDGIYGAGRVAEITSRWHAVGRLALGLDQPGTSFLIAEDGGRIVGTVSLVRGEDGTLDLKRLYVLPEAQSQGIGSRLLETALAAFHDTTAIRLEVEPANASAIRFYERNGFAVTGRTSDCSCSGDGIAALIMTRDSRVAAKPAAPLAKSAVSSDGMAAKR